MDPNTPSPNMPPVEIYSQTPAAPAAAPVQPTVMPPPPKKGLPKALFVIPIILLVGILGFFLYRTFFAGKAGGSGEITWWGLWEEESVVAPLIAEYEASHPRVKITYQKQAPQDYR